MLPKLNDLVRNVNRILAITRSSIRIWLITAQYCNLAVYEDSKKTIVEAVRKSETFVEYTERLFGSMVVVPNIIS